MNIPFLIKSALATSYTYSAYKELIHQLFSEGKTTGNVQSEAFVEYTKLAISRMKRWEKRVQIDDKLIDSLQQIEKPQTWLVISEAWCGDAAHALPVLDKLAKTNPLIELRIVLRDDNEELMDAFLTNGGRSIPKLIALSKDQQKVLFTWGPRPALAQQIVDDAKASAEGINQQSKEALQMWFNKDKGKAIQKEVVKLAAHIA